MTKRLLMTVGLVALAGSALAQSAPRLFVQPPAPRAIALDRAALGEYDVQVATGLLPAADRLVLDLPDGRSLSVRRTAFDGRSGGDYSWRGKVRLAVGEGDLVLAVKGSAVAGAVFTDAGNYEILPAPEGGQRLVELDDRSFAPCADPLEAPVTGVAGDAPLAPVAADDGEARIDVLVLYTAAARAGAGGTAAIESTAQAAVDITNTAYQNSGITTRMYLARTEEIVYTETGNSSTDLTWLAGNAGVRRLRDAYAADQVSMLVENGGGFCGVGYVQRNPGAGFSESAFQITARNCAVGNLSFAHEFGHNQGMEHDPANGTTPASASYTFAFGHFNDVVAPTGYRTVMSYSNQCVISCPRKPYFSNSTVFYNGLATGILNQRENYRTLNNTDTFVANFRPRGLLAELSGDNMPDILWRHGPSGTLYSWTMDGTAQDGGAFLGQLADSDWKVVGVRDFDNDGEGDILWLHVPSGSVYVWTMVSGVQTGVLPVGQVAGGGWDVVATGDFNGDEQTDIVWHHGPSGAVYIWTLNGTTVGGVVSVGAASTEWQIVGAGDFDDDGDPDILWHHSPTGALYVWTMTGTTKAGGAFAPGVADADWTVSGVADFNGDKHADIVWYHVPTGTLYVWTMSGTTQTGGVLVGQADTSWTVSAPQ